MNRGASFVYGPDDHRVVVDGMDVTHSVRRVTVDADSESASMTLELALPVNVAAEGHLAFWVGLEDVPTVALVDELARRKAAGAAHSHGCPGPDGCVCGADGL